jgi:hypothetical protein
MASIEEISNLKYISLEEGFLEIWSDKIKIYDPKEKKFQQKKLFCFISMLFGIFIILTGIILSNISVLLFGIFLFSITLFYINKLNSKESIQYQVYINEIICIKIKRSLSFSTNRNSTMIASIETKDQKSIKIKIEDSNNQLPDFIASIKQLGFILKIDTYKIQIFSNM